MVDIQDKLLCNSQVPAFKQCCGSETFISDPVSDPDPAFSEFRIRIQFRILDSNPDPDPGFESWSEKAKTSFSYSKKQIEEVGTAFLLE